MLECEPSGLVQPRFRHADPTRLSLGLISRYTVIQHPHDEEYIGRTGILRCPSRRGATVLRDDGDDEGRKLTGVEI